MNTCGVSVHSGCSLRVFTLSVLEGGAKVFNKDVRTGCSGVQ